MFDESQIIGLSDISITRELNSDKTEVISISTDLVFCKGGPFEYLRDNMWADCSNLNCDAYCSGDLVICNCEPIPFKLNFKDSKYSPLKCQITGALELLPTNSSIIQGKIKNPFWEFVYDPTAIATIGTFFYNNLQELIFPTVAPNGNVGPDIHGLLITDLMSNLVALCPELNGFCSSLLGNPIFDCLAIAWTSHIRTQVPPTIFSPAPRLDLVSNISICEIFQGLSCIFEGYSLRIHQDKIYFETEEFYNTLGRVFNLSDFDFDEDSLTISIKEQEDCTSKQYSYQDGPNDIAQTAEKQSWVISYLPDGSIGGNLCEKEIPFSQFAFNTNLIYAGATDSPTLIVWDKSTPRNQAQAVFDCGFYNYPLLLDPDLPCDNIGNQFLQVDSNSCNFQTDGNFEICPSGDFCEFINAFLNGEQFKILAETQCGNIILSPESVTLNSNTKTITLSNFEDE